MFSKFVTVQENVHMTIFSMKNTTVMDAHARTKKQISKTTKFFLIGIVVTLTITKALAEGEYTHCDTAYVPCPRAPGFQFFNKTCYGIIRDKLPFGAGDSYFKCESGMHLSFSDPSMSSEHSKLEQRTAMDKRMTLARVFSLGTLHVLGKLRRQVVPELSEETLVDLACTEDCTTPASWTFSASEAFPTQGGSCADTAACNWQRSSSTVWAQPPGARAALEYTADAPVKMPALNSTAVHSHEGGVHHTDTDADDEYAEVDWNYQSLRRRQAVMAGYGALKDVPESISLHSVACEIPFATTDEEIQHLLPSGLALDADMSLHAQMVHDLAIESLNGSRTAVLLTWRPPHCQAAEFYVTVLSDSDEGSANRSQVQTEDVCDEMVENCQLEMNLPLCSLLYIEVGAILEGADAAPDVVQWQTPAPADPLPPSSFVISEISGSVVTLTWESTTANGPCQPHHVITIQGHGQVTLKPGFNELKADLNSYCEHFDASVKATILGRSSSVHGPIHGVTGPTAPQTVHVLTTASTWALLEWRYDADESSTCVQAKYRVSCKPQPTAGLQPRGTAVSMTSPDRRLNVTGLLPGLGYRCGVCALASLMDTDPSDTALKKPPCGDIRNVDLATDETAPGIPDGLNITDTSHENLTLAWHRPQESNGVIIRYNISVRCQPQTFPLCTSDPLCVDRWFEVPLDGNDTDHVTYTVTGLQAARLHHVAVAAATAAGQGPFSLPLSAHTRAGVPPPPSHVTVTSQVKRVTGFAEQTSVSVSLRPPCPFPGLHDYRLRFERVDFLAGYQSTVRAAVLKPDEIQQLYSGKRNITFSVFDGKWTPGFNYKVRIVAHTDVEDGDNSTHGLSAPVNFTMTVPPPGMVRHLQADCLSQPLALSFSWANPIRNAFGIVSYRSRYQCRHPATGHQVSGGGWYSCHHSQCPCQSSQSRSNQCTACERVCNYPVKRFNFMGERTYYFNCTCQRQTAYPPIMPGSECQVTVQAESKYLEQRGEPSMAVCRTPEHRAQVTDLVVRCGAHTLAVSWGVPKPLEVPTEAYHISVQRRARDTAQQTTFVEEILRESQCDRTQCRAAWSGLEGDTTYMVRVSAESIYSTPAVGPAAEGSCLAPARVPLPPPESLPEQLEELSGWRDDLDPTRQYLLGLPSDLYDVTSGTLREVRVVISEPRAITSVTSEHQPPSGNITTLPEVTTWQQFQLNRTDHYLASPPAFIPDYAGADHAEFVLGSDLSCSVTASQQPAAEARCNGPLQPNTSYAVQLVFVNDAGFVSSRPFMFHTKSVREVEAEKGQREEAEAEGTKSDQTPSDGTIQQPRTNTRPPSAPGGVWHGAMGPIARSGDLPEQYAFPSDWITNTEMTSKAAPGNISTTTPEPDDSGSTVVTAVGASAGALAAVGSICIGAMLWRRRSRGGG